MSINTGEVIREKGSRDDEVHGSILGGKADQKTCHNISPSRYRLRISEISPFFAKNLSMRLEGEAFGTRREIGD
jgi:hypothetical protein